MRRWWRLDDWFRVVRRDGSVVARYQPARSYDATPPFWYRYAAFVNLLALLPVWFGIAYRDYRAVALGLSLSVAFGGLLFLWERRHRLPPANAERARG